MTQTRSLDFREIPKTSALYKDYLYDYSKVQEFLPCHYDLSHFREENLAQQPFLPHRDELCEVLLSQNHSFGAGEKTLENIEKLKASDCWAIVAGQQVGLFTGPAYTIYKALTAIKLAAHYNCRGVNTVPIFWMATEDHDLAEVDHCYLADTDSQLVRIRYESPTEDALKPVGKVSFNQSIEAASQLLLNGMPESEFKQEIESRVRSSYLPGQTFATSFGELFAWLFKNYGLILVDPLDVRLKQITAPWLEQVADSSEELMSKIRKQSQRLIDEGYHAQVTVESDVMGLFVTEEGKRRALVRDGDRWKVRGSERRLALNEVVKWIREEPALWSPNVLFRPLLQDLLLPTLATIAGPSEMAYLAQVEPLYAEFGRKPPIVFPRFSFTIIERKIGKILEKYSLDFQSILLGPEALMMKVIEQNLDQTLAQKFSILEQEIQQRLYELEAPLKAVDQTLAEALKTTQQKVLYQLNHLRTKFVLAESRHHEVLKRQIEKAFSLLYPLKTLQERRLNIFYFLSRYGMDFLAELFEEINLNDPGHRLLQLN